MDDLIWVNPKRNGAVGNCWHDASTVPVAGFVAYVRVDTMADAAAREKQAGSDRRTQEAVTDHITECCICGSIVDTREVEEGGSPDGAEALTGLWVCSPECWDDLGFVGKAMLAFEKDTLD